MTIYLRNGTICDQKTVANRCRSYCYRLDYIIPRETIRQLVKQHLEGDWIKGHDGYLISALARDLWEHLLINHSM